MVVLAKNFQAFLEYAYQTVILFIPKLRIRGRMDLKTILLKQTYPDESFLYIVFVACVECYTNMNKILDSRGCLGGVMVLGKLLVLGRPTIWIIVGQGPIALAAGAGRGLFGHFYSPLSFVSSFSLSLGDGPI